MNDYTTLITFINGVGFPIVAAVFMYKFSTQAIKENTKAITELREMMLEIKAIITREEK